MGPLHEAFSVCSWVRSLITAGDPSWLSYAVNSGSVNEILISDDGYYNFIFGGNSDLRSYFSSLSGTGTWFHYCYTWSYSSRTMAVYLNGQYIHSTTTSSSRGLQTGGYLVIGNDQNGSPGSGMSSSYIFGGEIFKLNLFSKELSSSEVQEMSQHKCSDVERDYGDTRIIKWEDILSLTRNGHITDIDSGCKATGKNNELLDVHA